MRETSLQYPVGRFEIPATITASIIAESIEGIAALPSAMRAAVDGLSEAQLATPYRDGGWSVRQVVHHVADSHMHAYVRVKFAFTEEGPTIRPYDEGAWALLPDVSTVPVATSLSLIDALHARWVACLRGLDASMLARTFVHPELGAQTVELSLLRYHWHGRHHVAHITSLRSRMGW
ncbi:MAG: putative metal-dependent hydrolase [Gemmatimonadaceae bacterium]|nr:putative metal-dependent hydrolase [Gemmatimonadaceae bacterium]